MTDRSPSRPARHRLGRPLAGVLAVLLGSAAGAVWTTIAPEAPAARAAGSVAVVNADGTATADPDYASTLTVTGSGFQSIAGGFGGVYVLFGWVDGSTWRPSQGGEVGSDYRYVPDQEAKQNAGFQRFVAFPGSDTADAANAVMDGSGGWSVELVVPGAEFQTHDRDGAVVTVDCRDVQCGVITIGAHGVKNANNETFTPVGFAAPATADGGAGGTAGTSPVTDAAAGATTAAGQVASGASGARVGYTGSTAVAGNALSFAGRGFSPGEQVVATLDSGVAAVGPLTAGAAGEVAAVLQVPADIRAGTHLLVLTGAASGAVAETEVTIVADEGAADLVTAAPAGEAVTPPWLWVALALALLVATALLVTSAVTALVRAGRRRARRAAPTTPAPSTTVQS